MSKPKIRYEFRFFKDGVKKVPLNLSKYEAKGFMERLKLIEEFLQRRLKQ